MSEMMSLGGSYAYQLTFVYVLTQEITHGSGLLKNKMTCIEFPSAGKGVQQFWHGVALPIWSWETLSRKALYWSISGV